MDLMSLMSFVLLFNKLWEKKDNSCYVSVIFIRIWKMYSVANQMWFYNTIKIQWERRKKTKLLSTATRSCQSSRLIVLWKGLSDLNWVERDNNKQNNDLSSYSATHTYELVVQVKRKRTDSGSESYVFTWVWSIYGREKGWICWGSIIDLDHISGKSLKHHKLAKEDCKESHGRKEKANDNDLHQKMVVSLS